MKKAVFVMFLAVLVVCPVCGWLPDADANGDKTGPRPGKKNPMTPNRASLFCDDELLMLVGYPEDHKINYWSFAPTKADLTDWSTESLKYQHNDDVYAVHSGMASPWAAASGRIAAYDHDQVVQVYFKPNGQTRVELWDFPSRLKYVNLSGSIWSYKLGYVDVAVGDLDLVVDDKGYYHDEIVVARTVKENNYEVQVEVVEAGDSWFLKVIREME
jgi:hypothetical protein